MLEAAQVRAKLRGVEAVEIAYIRSKIARGYGTTVPKGKYDTGFPGRSPGKPVMMRIVGWAWEELNLRAHAYQACALTT